MGMQWYAFVSVGSRVKKVSKNTLKYGGSYLS
jgi:hypothetical protein